MISCRQKRSFRRSSFDIRSVRSQLPPSRSCRSSMGQCCRWSFRPLWQPCCASRFPRRRFRCRGWRSSGKQLVLHLPRRESTWDTSWAAAGFSAGGFGFPFRQHLIVSSVAGQRRLTRLHAGGRLVLERYHAAFPGRFVQGLRFPPPEGRVVGKTIQATAREMLRGAISGETLFAAWK